MEKPPTLRRIWSGQTALLAAGGLALLAALIFLGEEIHLHLQAMEAWVGGLGPWGPVAFVFIFVLGTSLLVPESVLLVVAGAIFGMGWGALAALAGSLAAAACQYLLARSLLRERIRRLVAARPPFAAIQRAVLRDELRLQLLLRLTPLNPAALSYALGAAGVRPSTFLPACLIQAPQLLLELYVGHAGSHLAGMAGARGHDAQLHDLLLFGGLALSAAVVVMGSRIARKAVFEAAANPA